jgi:hypothetical protein
MLDFVQHFFISARRKQKLITIKVKRHNKENLTAAEEKRKALCST